MHIRRFGTFMPYKFMIVKIPRHKLQTTVAKANGDPGEYLFLMLKYCMA